jgi:hypothetical protein
MPIKRITDEIVLQAIEDLCGDGYCLVADVLDALPRGRRHLDRRSAISRTVRRGLAIERRGPDGRAHIAISSEGWRALREMA